MFWLRFWMFGAIWVAWFCCSLLLIAADHPITDPEEVSALKEVKKSLVDWDRNLDNWKHGDPCTSNWIGVLCFDTTKDDGYLHVKELLLLNMSLSGSLSPELGRFSHLEILDVMWNKISGTIPKEIGNISSLQLLLLNGNQLTGFLPEELGYLPNLDRIQIDENQISGPIPASFSNLKLAKHFHMNNNSLSGQIPTELSRLPKLVHLLLDNNNLSGHLPRELAQMPNLRILQLDNNRFDGSTIPASYSNMSRLLKLSLRNCGLIGTVPDLSRIPNLTYIDLSSNQLNGSISPYRLSENITTIDLSNNSLTGTIPSNFSGLPRLQILSLAYNRLNGSVQSIIWQSRTFHRNDTFILDFKNNTLSNISGSLDHLPNVRIRLQGNPICSNPNMVEFCGNRNEFANDILNSTNSTGSCTPNACPQFYEYAPEFPEPERCSCLLPVLVGFRLKSPGFSIFQPYIDRFEEYLTSGLQLKLYQLHIDSFVWEKGPRLNMYLKIFPAYNNHEFNTSEVLRLQALFSGWTIRDNEFFGPHELLGFTLVDRYRDAIPRSSSYISKGALAGIILAAIAGSVILSAIVSILIWRVQMRKFHPVSKRRELSKLSIKIDGVKDFSYEEMMMATNNFDRSSEVGHGGYGKVYKGILADGTVVAIKRAQEGSLQGVKEFLTEIELLSRLHHRNLVSLLGYCDEEGEQMLVYEFMCNGTLREHLSGKFKVRLSFAMRLKIALDSAKGILYLHTEADPPIFHRDIKATNILLDSKLTAKVADFGLSRLAPVPDIEGTVPAYVSTVVKGTPGYLDPEYFLTHMLTDKSDVYSLGVVFLELLTGMQPISHGKNIVREVNNAYRSGIIFSIIDEKMGFYPSQCVEKFVTLALKCCQEETDSRPSMANVVWELETIWLLMPESDTTTTTIDSSSISDSVTTLPSSSSTSKSPYISGDVYGSYLDGGVISNITPR